MATILIVPAVLPRYFIFTCNGFQKDNRQFWSSLFICLIQEDLQVTWLWRKKTECCSWTYYMCSTTKCSLLNPIMTKSSKSQEICCKWSETTVHAMFFHYSVFATQKFKSPKRKETCFIWIVSSIHALPLCSFCNPKIEIIQILKYTLNRWVWYTGGLCHNGLDPSPTHRV